MVYNKCIFCCEVYATNAKSSVCDKCTIILAWKSGMDCLAAVNRLSDLLRTNKLDSNFKNENYCKERFRHACHPSYNGCNRFLKEIIKINSSHCCSKRDSYKIIVRESVITFLYLTSIILCLAKVLS